MMKAPKIGLDIDDVIADFCGCFIKKYNFKKPIFWNFSYNTKSILSNKEEM